jgi:RND family efflux transporter MFP subunit
LKNFIKQFKAAWIQSGDQPDTRKLYKVGLFLVIGLIVFLVGITAYKKVIVWRAGKSLEQDFKAGPKVRTYTVKKSPGEEKIVLSGETRPYSAATLYAKISGYLAEVKVDKGDLVKKDQVLAIINSPETSKEYRAALSDARNKKAIAERMKDLRERNLVSQQEADQAFSDADIAEARLETQAIYKGYELLRAPFDGTVTSRYVDPGGLIQNAMNSQSSSQPVVTVSQINRLRTYAYADQKYAYYIQKNDPVVITLPERQELKVQATVTRMAGELDPKTRMMLIEIEVDNTKGELVAGSLVDVHIDVKLPSYPQVPVEATMLKDGKLFASLITPEGNIHYQEVTVGDNDGHTVIILSGLKEGDQVALDLGNSIPEGGHVRAIASEESKKEKSAK